MSSQDSRAQRHIPRHIPHRFSPRAVEVGRFLAYGDAADTRAFLEEINCRWPDLSFRDFWGAYVLAEAVAWKPEGKA
jgi:hypothetical protein